MNEQSRIVAAAEPASIWDQVRALRLSRQETGEQFGALIGLSKSKVSELETGKYTPSVQTALAVEQLAAGQIDAAELCDDVRAARESVHAAENARG